MRRQHPFSRAERMSQQIHRELGDLFLHGSFRDPNLKGITVTSVDLSKDLRHARVNVQVQQEGVSPKDVLASLERAQGYIRTQIANRLTSKLVPNFRFWVDESLDAMSHIETLLAESRAASAPDADFEG